MQRVRQRDLAEALQLDRSTVAKALRGDPRIAPATRAAVAEAAARLGYRPDPMLSALAAYRAARKSAEVQSCLGWVYNHPRSVAMDHFPAYTEYLVGARRQAARLGYRIEEFWIGRQPRAAERLGRTLLARGVDTLVLAPQEDLSRPLTLPWDRLCTVAIGYSLKSPELHRVTIDHFQAMTQAVEQLAARGYRRLGCYLWQTDNDRIEHRALSAFLALSGRLNVAVQLYSEFRPREFARWAKAHRLDAVLTREPCAAEILHAAGLTVPDAMGVALYTRGLTDGTAGFYYANDLVGAAAVDLAVRQRRQGEFGLPAHPLRVLLSARWIEGPTLKPQTAARLVPEEGVEPTRL